MRIDWGSEAKGPLFLRPGTSATARPGNSSERVLDPGVFPFPSQVADSNRGLIPSAQPCTRVSHAQSRRVPGGTEPSVLYQSIAVRISGGCSQYLFHRWCSARRFYEPKNVSSQLSRPCELSIWTPCTNICKIIPLFFMVWFCRHTRRAHPLVVG